MSTRLQSRAWSCSELVRGAAQVVDEMPAPSLNEMVVSEKHRLLGETSDLSADDIEKLLQDPCMTNFIQSRDYCQKKCSNHARAASIALSVGVTDGQDPLLYRS